MELWINGTLRHYPGSCRTVADLLGYPEWKHRLVIIELNGGIIGRENYDEAPLKSGDRLEIVHFVGGG